VSRRRGDLETPGASRVEDLPGVRVGVAWLALTPSLGHGIVRAAANGERQRRVALTGPIQGGFGWSAPARASAPAVSAMSARQVGVDGGRPPDLDPADRERPPRWMSRFYGGAPHVAP
jgi:hypothetical protein